MDENQIIQEGFWAHRILLLLLFLLLLLLLLLFSGTFVVERGNLKTELTQILKSEFSISFRFLINNKKFYHFKELKKMFDFRLYIFSSFNFLVFFFYLPAATIERGKTI